MKAINFSPDEVTRVLGRLLMGFIPVGQAIRMGGVVSEIRFQFIENWRGEFGLQFAFEMIS